MGLHWTRLQCTGATDSNKLGRAGWSYSGQVHGRIELQKAYETVHFGDQVGRSLSRMRVYIDKPPRQPTARSPKKGQKHLGDGELDRPDLLASAVTAAPSGKTRVE